MHWGRGSALVSRAEPVTRRSPESKLSLPRLAAPETSGEAAASSCALRTRTEVRSHASSGPRGAEATLPAAPEGLISTMMLFGPGARAGLTHSTVPRTAPGRAATFTTPVGSEHRRVGPATSASSEFKVRTVPPSSNTTPGSIAAAGPTRRTKKLEVASAANAPGSNELDPPPSSPPFVAVTEKRPAPRPSGVSAKASRDETIVACVWAPPMKTCAALNMCAPSKDIGSPPEESGGRTVETCATAWY